MKNKMTIEKVRNMVREIYEELEVDLNEMSEDEFERVVSDYFKNQKQLLLDYKNTKG
jgi:hypothetical protein